MKSRGGWNHFEGDWKYRYAHHNTHIQLALEKPVEEIDSDIWMYYVSLQLS